MDRVWFVAAIWLLLALVAVLASNWLRISRALSDIVAGTVAQLVIGALAGSNTPDAKAEWVTFLAGTGATVLLLVAIVDTGDNLSRLVPIVEDTGIMEGCPGTEEGPRE